jgi:LmbE family N-acetylglucosaminyl deacetylase
MDFTPLLTSLAKPFPAALLSSKTPAPQTILILSPHPDDECIVGSLALRLMLENGARVVNVAVTLGSKVERRKERAAELTAACRHLGIELVFLEESWSKKKGQLKKLIQKEKPSLILAPHLKDFHPTHIRTGELLKETLAALTSYKGVVAWTEFWGQLQKPNLLVQVPTELLLRQMQALELHAGEVERNPYHLRLPAWMMDNVRRGSEIIAGTGASASAMAFAVIYQLQTVEGGKLRSKRLAQNFWSASDDLSQLLRSLG